jgi:hypothetical protein
MSVLIVEFRVPRDQDLFCRWVFMETHSVP